jgi:2-polyprenyl-3-methyl-5-hydroxy-6-metoxy-1,4-benzoquinol methylase
LVAALDILDLIFFRAKNIGQSSQIKALLSSLKKIDKVFVGTFKDVYKALPNYYFDCVICCDVIEHMNDENWFLTNIKKKMNSKSVIIGSIPNVRYIDNLLRLLIKRD